MRQVSLYHRKVELSFCIIAEFSARSVKRTPILEKGSMCGAQVRLLSKTTPRNKQQETVNRRRPRLESGLLDFVSAPGLPEQALCASTSHSFVSPNHLAS